MFIVNLAIFDLLMMLEMPMFIANSFYERLLGYDLGCTIYAALGSLSGKIKHKYEILLSKSINF